MKPTRLFIADANEIARIGVKATLTQRANYETCGEAADGRTAVEQTLRLCPDLVILDVDLPLLNGLEAARQILSQRPQTRVLIFTEKDSERVMREVLRSGIRGFVRKSDPSSDLVTAAEALLNGRTFFTSRMTPLFVESARKQSRNDLLSYRQREILQLLVEGFSGKAIATMLGLSAKTIDTHRSNMMQKLNVNSTAKLILYAIRNEMINIPKLPCSLASDSPSDAFWETSSEKSPPINVGREANEITAVPTN